MASKSVKLTEAQIKARSPGPSYQDLLDKEVNPVPASLRENTNPYLGSENLSADRYLSREFHELEVEHVWKRTWQAVCRDTEISEAGDTFVYDITRFSIIVTRTEAGTLKAYKNACLHRGRQLIDKNGNYENFRCPYHAFTWKLDGSFKGAPCKWDFPHIEDDKFGLPEVQVDTWGGWVFINMDENAVSLSEYMGVMVDHFERWQPENTYKAMHLKKVIRCNWKLANEAFIESYHTVATHPQLKPYTADANSQYDCFNEHVSRTITAMGVGSPHLPDLSEQKTADQWMLVNEVLSAEQLEAVPAGMTAREYLGRYNIKRYSQIYQQDLSQSTYSEILDAILYLVFPNFAPWGGFRPNVTYRFLPYNDSHEECTMEIFVMMRYPPDQPRPRDCQMIFVPADQSFAKTDGISDGLATVFDQDFSNLPMVHKGLRSLASGRIELGNYQEVRIRHFHQTLDKYLDL